MNKTKQEWITELLTNPRYSSGWIDLASDLLADGAFTTIGDLEKYNPEELSVIKTAWEVKDKLDFKKLLYSNLNATQMQLYVLGIQKEVAADKMDVFLDNKIPYAKSNFIVQALTEGYDDILNYIDFDINQVYEIYAGMKSNVPYSNYALPCLDSKQMAIIRFAMEQDLSVDLEGDKIIIYK